MLKKDRIAIVGMQYAQDAMKFMVDNNINGSLVNIGKEDFVELVLTDADYKETTKQMRNNGIYAQIYYRSAVIA